MRLRFFRFSISNAVIRRSSDFGFLIGSNLSSKTLIFDSRNSSSFRQLRAHHQRTRQKAASVVYFHAVAAFYGFHYHSLNDRAALLGFHDLLPSPLRACPGAREHHSVVVVCPDEHGGFHFVACFQFAREVDLQPCSVMTTAEHPDFAVAEVYFGLLEVDIQHCARHDVAVAEFVGISFWRLGVCFCNTLCCICWLFGFLLLFSFSLLGRNFNFLGLSFLHICLSLLSLSNNLSHLCNNLNLLSLRLFWHFLNLYRLNTLFSGLSLHFSRRGFFRHCLLGHNMQATKPQPANSLPCNPNSQPCSTSALH